MSLLRIFPEDLNMNNRVRTSTQWVKMRNGRMRLSFICLAVLLLPGLAMAQGIPFDLILERTFTSHTSRVGVDYDGRGRPLFTIASEDRVEVMDSDGNIEIIVSGLNGATSAARPSPNGRFVGILRWSYHADSLSGAGYTKSNFTLKRRDGRTVYELAKCPFNDFEVANNGGVWTRWTVLATQRSDCQYYDVTGNPTYRLPSHSSVIPFGEEGSYLVYTRDTVSAYTGGHTLLWSIDLLSSPREWKLGAANVSADGRYFVRYDEPAAEFYRDGQLVKVDTTLTCHWLTSRVAMAPDNRHALLTSPQKAYLWDLEQCAVVRTLDPPGTLGAFGPGVCSSEGQYAVILAAEDTTAPTEQLICLYDQNGQIVWQAEAPPRVAKVSRRPWLTIDPTATYISQRDSEKIWLYERR